MEEPGVTPGLVVNIEAAFFQGPDKVFRLYDGKLGHASVTASCSLRGSARRAISGGIVSPVFTALSK